MEEQKEASPLLRLKLGIRVAIHHPNLKGVRKGTYRLALTAGEGERLVVVQLDECPNVPPPCPCPGLVKEVCTANFVDESKALFIPQHQVEAGFIKLEPLPCLRQFCVTCFKALEPGEPRYCCPKCQKPSCPHHLLDSMGLLPVAAMSDGARQTESKLKELRLRYATRWAQLAESQGTNVEYKVSWVVNQQKSEGGSLRDFPSQRCDNASCGYLVAVHDIWPLLDHDTRQELSLNSPASPSPSLTSPRLGGTGRGREVGDGSSSCPRTGIQPPFPSGDTKFPSQRPSPSKFLKDSSGTRRCNHLMDLTLSNLSDDEDDKDFEEMRREQERAVEEDVGKLVDMGYGEVEARRARRQATDLEQAIDMLAPTTNKDQDARDKPPNGERAPPAKIEEVQSPERIGVGDQVIDMEVDEGLIRLDVYEDREPLKTVTLSVDPADPGTTWGSFIEACVNKLSLDPKEHFVDSVELVQDVGFLGPRRTEIHDLKALRSSSPPYRVCLKTVLLDPSPVIPPNMGPEEDITSLALDFCNNTSIGRKVRELGVDYPRWRRVRGDGNCYYRAVMFGLLERCAKDRLARARLIKLLRDLNCPDLEEEDAKGMVVDWLGSWASDSSGMPLDEVLNDTSNGMDMALVMVSRRLVSQYARAHRSDKLRGALTMEELAKTEDMTFDEYCQERIEKPGVDAEGFILDVGILPQILGVRCHTWILDKNQRDLSCIIRPEVEGPEMMADIHIHLLLVPGHYSYLIPRTKAALPPPNGDGRSAGVRSSTPSNVTPTASRPSTSASPSSGRGTSTSSSTKARSPWHGLISSVSVAPAIGGGGGGEDIDQEGAQQPDDNDDHDGHKEIEMLLIKVLQLKGELVYQGPQSSLEEEVGKMIAGVTRTSRRLQMNVKQAEELEELFRKGRQRRSSDLSAADGSFLWAEKLADDVSRLLHARTIWRPASLR